MTIVHGCDVDIRRHPGNLWYCVIFCKNLQKVTRKYASKQEALDEAVRLAAGSIPRYPVQGIVHYSPKDKVRPIGRAVGRKHRSHVGR